MKKNKKTKRISPAFRAFYPVLIMVSCLLMSVGYATINSIKMQIDGDIIAMEQEGVVVTDISYKTNTAANINSSNVNVVDGTIFNSDIVLSSTNASSSITYTITVYNTNSYDCFYNGTSFDDEFYNNENIIFELSDNMVEGMFLESGAYLSFDITFKYKDGVVPSTTINTLSAYVNIDFPAVAMLKPTTMSDTSGFRAYKNSIKNINFEDKINVPSNVVNSWDIGVSETGDVMAYLVTNTSDSNYYDLYIQSDTQLYANEDMGWWFYRFANIDSIGNLKLLDTSRTTDMREMFYETGLSSTAFTLDVSNFDTSKVTDMSYMFYYTGAANTSFTLDVSNFETSNVTDMSWMFARTGNNSTLFTLDVSGFDTSKVTDMAYMFSSTGYNSTMLTIDVSNFDTSKVTDMAYMFNNAGYSSTVFDLDVSNFDTSNVTSMENMFYYAGYVNTSFTLDVSNFDTSKVTNMSGMFCHAGEKSTVFTLDVSGFDTSNVTTMYMMFRMTGYVSPTFTLDVSGFDTSQVTDMHMMFNSTGFSSSVFALNVSNFNTSKVTDMSYMFFQAGSSNPGFTLDVSNFDTRKVTNMSHMFDNTGKESTVFTLDISNFDTSKVTNMGGMFYYTGMNSTVFQLDVSNFDTSNVTNMNSMFYRTGQSNPNFTLDVSGFDTSKVTDMYRMFYNTGVASTKLNTSITIRNPNMTSYDGMFLNIAVKTGTKITVNYTSETSDLVDKMIATKSDTSNVVKGYNVDSMISFTIDDNTTYNAYEGMTWEQWVDSEFNTDGYSIYEDELVIDSSGYEILGETLTSTIIEGTNYTKNTIGVPM